MLTFLGTALIICLIGIMLGLWWIARYLLIIQPQQEKDSLELFSVFAVSDTLLRHPYLNELEQRQKAEEKLQELFDERGMILTGGITISAAIGWAMHKKQQEEVRIDLEKLRAEIERADIVKKTTSIRLPIVKTKKIKALKAPYTPRLHPSGEITL
jgi:hypothetical protein